MSYPPQITKNEHRILGIIANGHPERTIQITNRSGTRSVNALEWSEIQIASGCTSSEFGDCIAHLVAHQYIESVYKIPGIIGRIRGNKKEYFFWATSEGKRLLENTSEEEVPEEIALPDPHKLTAQDIDDAVRVLENSFSSEPYVDEKEVIWAQKVLDDDIRGEIEEAAYEVERMWLAFEKTFGHKGAVATEREASVRDPAIKRSTVRVYRAKDEQRRRKGFPPSRKPESWLTHYQSGNIELPPAPWE